LAACRNDPNYDSDEERSVLMAANSSHSRVQAEVAAYKQEVRSSSSNNNLLITQQQARTPRAYCCHSLAAGYIGT
jgi:hypothetical protein